ncbi:MAG TPA: DedA family protein [Proteobacteria bacterium]|nr:DedA family protein [Pseudomonadota bacterium]
MADESKAIPILSPAISWYQRTTRKLYDWVLHWAETPYGVPALALITFAEASFFPIPPDVLLIALAISIPKRSFRYALVCSITSVFGGLLGYLIGYALFESVGRPILEFYGYMDKFLWLKLKYDEVGAWLLAMAGFTPIPYKVFTITSGVMKMNLVLFTVVSLISRSARFFLVGALIYFFGPPVKRFIDRYFNLLSVVFVVLLIGGFVVLKWLL